MFLKWSARIGRWASKQNEVTQTHAAKPTCKPHFHHIWSTRILKLWLDTRKFEGCCTAVTLKTTACTIFHCLAHQSCPVQQTWLRWLLPLTLLVLPLLCLLLLLLILWVRRWSSHGWPHWKLGDMHWKHLLAGRAIHCHGTATRCHQSTTVRVEASTHTGNSAKRQAHRSQRLPSICWQAGKGFGAKTKARTFLWTNLRL